MQLFINTMPEYYVSAKVDFCICPRCKFYWGFAQILPEFIFKFEILFNSNINYTYLKEKTLFFIENSFIKVNITPAMWDTSITKVMMYSFRKGLPRNFFLNAPKSKTGAKMPSWHLTSNYLAVFTLFQIFPIFFFIKLLSVILL